LTGKQLVRLSETVGDLHARCEVQNMTEKRLERQGFAVTVKLNVFMPRTREFDSGGARR
jgi:hypothetical protein